jgi:choline dehydrogenase
MSAALLLRSGIGDADHFRDVGLDVRHALAAVGYGLVDQPGVVIVGVPRPGVIDTDGPVLQALLRCGFDDGHGADAFYQALNHVDLTGQPGVADLVGAPVVIGLMGGDLHPRSRGTGRLRSSDPLAPPELDLAFFTAPGHPPT